jgi:hypothetical protein
MKGCRTILLLILGGVFWGCASDPKSDVEVASNSPQLADLDQQEAQREQICASIAAQLRTSATGSRPDGLFPYPQDRNREESGFPGADVEVQRLRAMQQRYRCF